MDRVRLIGVDTPDVYGVEPCGQEASAYTKQHLEGRQVTLEIGEDAEDPYDRLLAYVFVGNEFFSETLVSEDLADAVSYLPNTKYDPELEASEASASAGTSASASASPNPSGGASSKLSNSIDDVNCEDLSGPVQVGSNDEDYLDADGNGTGCD